MMHDLHLSDTAIEEILNSLKEHKINWLNGMLDQTHKPFCQTVIDQIEEQIKLNGCD